MMALLEISDLHVTVDGKEILKGLDLAVEAGKVHAIMGPNGSGKSTLSYVLAGRDGYEVTQGAVTFDGQDLLVEIPGVTGMTFLKTAVNAVRKHRGEPELDAMDFLKYVRVLAADLGVSDDMLKRAVNTGFSGGEKKRMEILQMATLAPRLAVLDETDSGLDVDALKVVAGGVNAMRSPDRGMLVITHYQRLLDYIVPDHVHILAQGRIVRTGDKDLALAVEENGYAEFLDAAA